MDASLYHKLVEDAVMLFVVVDPVGSLPLFLAATKHVAEADRKKIAVRAVIYAFFIMVFFVVAGQILLDEMHIKLGAFEIAGGLILFLVGVQMVFEKGHDGGQVHPESGHDIAVFPIALPILAGPPAIVTAVLLTDNNKFSVMQQAMTTGVMACVLALTCMCLRLAGPIHRLIGESGSNIVSRVMGIILSALSIQLVLTGIESAFQLGVE